MSESQSLYAGAGSLLFDPAEAVLALCAVDPPLAAVIARVGPCRLQVADLHTPFASLTESIVHQQITGKAAASILGRFRASIGAGELPPPEAVLAASEEELRACGLSRPKIAALRDLAQKTLDGVVPAAADLPGLGDEELVTRLSAVRGIGRWTVEMMLIFRLGRPDVLPVQDYGVRKGFARTYGQVELPSPLELMRHGERWRPYRTVASWYLWRALELPAEPAPEPRPTARPAARPTPKPKAPGRAAARPKAPGRDKG